VASTRLPTKWGEFQLVGFERKVFTCTRRVETAFAMILGDMTGPAPLVRIHSQCFTGEVLGSLRCDCNDQLELAMRAIAAEGRGVIMYEHQEGRGIGLMAKLRAYALQDGGLDTIEANHALGFKADCRDFTLSTAILRQLGIDRVRLLSNNPAKVRALIDAGIEVVERVDCEAAPTPHSLPYLRTKKERMGHALRLWQPDGDQELLDDEPRQGSPFASIEDAIAALRAGRMIVVVDDGDREDEGDLVMAADRVTPEAINFMAKHGRGLICLAMTGERADQLELDPMVPDNCALGGTAFTVSIDARGADITTGISALDRAQTIRAAVDASSSAEDFARPGHVFPLRACEGGVLERRGHTEAAVDLARLAGRYPAGVICEILRDDGTMARVPDLVRFCRTHGLLMITVADLARYRLESDCDESVYATGSFLCV
jgi:3,4-dihydroxy-2-butanone 4-phosphate synthase/GTP cyclohydrolase II